MRALKNVVVAAVVVTTLLFLPVATASAAVTTSAVFAGTITSTMHVNDGTTSGYIYAGTPYTGTLVFDAGQTATPAPYGGGTRTSYRFTTMTFTIAGSTASTGPGTIDVFDNLTSGVGYPTGDSLYVNFTQGTPNTTGVAPSGPLAGLTFNWMGLALLDPSGSAITGGTIPANLSSAPFSTHFSEFNFGTLGWPWGAGNTSMIQSLASLTSTTTGTTPPAITTTSLPSGVVNVPYSASVAASAPNGDPVTLSVTGLPAGLSFSGSSISGTPTAVGTSTVLVTATDTVTNLTATASLPLTISGPTITFSPSLPDGAVGAAYSATFGVASGGTGSFTYTAAGLPPGLSLSGTTVSGTPTTAGAYDITLTATDSAGASMAATVPVTISAPPLCSGSNAVETAFVPRTPGYIVVNGGLNLLDHLWTTNLDASNTTFLGGLQDWYQTGLILSYTGTVDPAGCILDHLTVAPAVTISTTSLPPATVGLSYKAPVTAAWGVAPYTLSVVGLPAGLSFDGTNIAGTPSAAGSFDLTLTATDAVQATASRIVPLTVGAGGSYTVKDNGTGRITAIAPDYSYLMVGGKKLIWGPTTAISVHTPTGEIHVIDGFVKVGMKVQWRGLRDRLTNTVLTTRLEVG